MENKKENEGRKTSLSSAPCPPLRPGGRRGRRGVRSLPGPGEPAGQFSGLSPGRGIASVLLRVFKSSGAASAIYLPPPGLPVPPRTGPEPAITAPSGPRTGARKGFPRRSASLPSCWVALPPLLPGINRALGSRPLPPHMGRFSCGAEGPRRRGRPRSAAREGDSCRLPSRDLFPLTAGPQVTCVGGDE